MPGLPRIGLEVGVVGLLLLLRLECGEELVRRRRHRVRSGMGVE